MGLSPRQIGRQEGRRLFGADPEAYDRGRPGHPEGVYELLVEVCGLEPGSRVLEIGPGTGQATRRLLELGANVVAIEPNAALARHIGVTLERVTVFEGPLEEVKLPRSEFDLAAAASSFHWIDESAGLSKIFTALRPCGWVALWWSMFGAGEGEHPFHEAARDALDRVYADRGVMPDTSPSAPRDDRPRHGLDVAARTAALAAAGFERIEHRQVPWTHTWDTAGIRALYASFSPILTLDDATRGAVLDAVAELALREFHGRVTLGITTSLYMARRPG